MKRGLKEVKVNFYGYYYPFNHRKYPAIVSSDFLKTSNRGRKPKLRKSDSEQDITAVGDESSLEAVVSEAKVEEVVSRISSNSIQIQNIDHEEVPHSIIVSDKCDDVQNEIVHETLTDKHDDDPLELDRSGSVSNNDLDVFAENPVVSAHAVYKSAQFLNDPCMVDAPVEVRTHLQQDVVEKKNDSVVNESFQLLPQSHSLPLDVRESQIDDSVSNFEIQQKYPGFYASYACSEMYRAIGDHFVRRENGIKHPTIGCLSCNTDRDPSDILPVAIEQSDAAVESIIHDELGGPVYTDTKHFWDSIDSDTYFSAIDGSQLDSELLRLSGPSDTSNIPTFIPEISAAQANNESQFAAPYQNQFIQSMLYQRIVSAIIIPANPTGSLNGADCLPPTKDSLTDLGTTKLSRLTCWHRGSSATVASLREIGLLQQFDWSMIDNHAMKNINGINDIDHEIYRRQRWIEYDTLLSDRPSLCTADDEIAITIRKLENDLRQQIEANDDQIVRLRKTLSTVDATGDLERKRAVNDKTKQVIAKWKKYLTPHAPIKKTKKR